MTFAEYNTDANFDNDKSSLDELVKIGLSEGKTSDEIKNSLSPKWQKSKKIGEFDNYISKYSKPKEEIKPTEEKVTEKVIEETTAPKEETEETIKQKNKAANKQNEDSLTQEQIEYQNQRRNKEQVWNNTLDSMERQKEAFNNIDDHMVEQLPTFMFKRYQNGEFGDPKGSDAKLRLAHFMINGLGTALSNMSHVIRKDGQTEDSDFEKYQKTNMQQGLENRWQKYKEETAAAMDLAKKRGIADEDLSEAIAKISSNNRLQASFNRMNEEQKVFTLQVMSEIGDEMGNMSDEKFANTLIGFATSGDSLDYKEAAAMLVYRYIKDPDKQQELLNKLGFGDMGGLFGGIGGALGGGKEEGNDSNSATAIKLSDGTTLDVGKMLSLNDFSQISNAAKDLSDRYYRGEITENEFRDDYNKLYNLVQSHNIMNKITGTLKPVDKRVKELNTDRIDYWNRQIDDLNKKANNGLIKPSDYADKFAELEKSYVKAGGDAKKVAKKKQSTEQIIKSNEKIEKAKSKKK